MLSSACTIGLAAVIAAGPRGTTYHVSPAGSDAGRGTAKSPWATPHRAAAAVKPGDTVLLHGGVYLLDGRLDLTGSGAPGRWITFAAAPGEKAVLDAAAVKPSNGRDASHFAAIYMEGAAYVRLVGLTVRNSHFAGIMVRGPSHHIDIAGCTVDMTFAPGIGAWNCTDLRVIGCEVTNANTQRMRLFGSSRVECPHEAISIAGVDRFEAAWNHVHHCEKEGIDVKEVSKHGIVHHNYVHDMPRQGLYADAWFGLLTDVEFASNVVHDCEWGVVLSVEGRQSEMRDVRVHHNVLYRNRASGIFHGTWGVNGPRSAIRFEHNTLYANGRPSHWSGPTGNIDLRAASARDVLVADNLCAAGGAYEIATFIDGQAEPARFVELGIRFERNLVGSDTDRTEGPAPYGRPYVVRGQGVTVGSVRFRAPDQGDLRPVPDSPVFARDGYRGAFAPRARTLPRASGQLVGFRPFRPATGAFPACLRP